MNRGKAYIEAGKERIRKNDTYDMTMTELKALAERALQQGDISTVIGDAFYMGVETGASIIEDTKTA